MLCPQFGCFLHPGLMITFCHALKSYILFRIVASEPNLKLRSRLRHKVAASKRTISSSSPLAFRRREKSVGGHSPVAKSFSGIYHLTDLFAFLLFIN